MVCVQCPMTQKLLKLIKKWKKYGKVFDDKYMLGDKRFYPPDSNVGAGPHKSWSDNASELHMLSVVRIAGFPQIPWPSQGSESPVHFFLCILCTLPNHNFPENMIFILKTRASLAGPCGFSKLLSSLESNLESQKFLFFFLFHLEIMYLQKWTGSLGMRRFHREGLPNFWPPSAYWPWGSQIWRAL